MILDEGIHTSVKMFRVRIGKPHRSWQGIASRKRLRYTRFLAEMKGMIEKRVVEEAVK